MKQVFEPDLLVAASFIGNGWMTAWGTFDEGPSRFKLEVFRGVSDRFTWALCPRDPSLSPGTILMEADITGDGIKIFDEMMRHEYLYPLADPECFQKAIDHLCHGADVKLGETECRMEWVVQQQEVNEEFDIYGDVESRLYVLKKKRPLFLQRRKALKL